MCAYAYRPIIAIHICMFMCYLIIVFYFILLFYNITSHSLEQNVLGSTDLLHSFLHIFNIYHVLTETRCWVLIEACKNGERV